MMKWWFGAVPFLAIVYAMENGHVVFTEEPVSTTLNSQEMDRFHKLHRKHFHNINGKLVFCFRYVSTLFI
jgi:hypothetical protein